MPTRESGDQKYYRLLARVPSQVSSEEARQYRDSDSHLDDPAHTDLGNALTRVCRSFKRPLTVLDLGCGCGRYFRFLEGAERIIGIDVSLEMLKQAKHPAGEEQIHAEVGLLCSDMFSAEFPDHTFDLIYSCGVFGLWAPLDKFVLAKISRWLKPDGRVFLAVIDASSPVPTTLKNLIASSARIFLPAFLKRYLDSRPGSKYLRLYENELVKLMTDAGFQHTIWRRGNPQRRIDLVCEGQMSKSAADVFNQSGI